MLDTIQSLKEHSENILKSAFIGIDIESDSMYTYQAAISLIQIATEDSVYLLDMQVLSKEPFVISFITEMFENGHAVKIFQDMQYDLSLLNGLYQIVPVNLFDISNADRLLRVSQNHQDLQKMVVSYLKENFDIKKSMQKSNWSKRPLSAKQIEYAVNDVKFHIPLYLKMKSLLKVDYRFDCFRILMENQKILNLGRKFNPDFMWRLKNVNSLSNEQKHILLLLLINRDKFAKRVNRPQHWIISDYKLVEIAAQQDIDEKLLESLFSPKKRNSTFWPFLSRMMLTTFNEIYESDDLSLLERPPIGTALKRWIPLVEEKVEYIPIRGMRKLIKEWGIQLSQRINLLPEYLIDKHELTRLASYDFEEFMEQMIFPGIPSKLHEAVVDDLKKFLQFQQTDLNFDVLLELYSS